MFRIRPPSNWVRVWLRVPAHPLFAQLIPVFEFLVEVVSFTNLLILKLPMKGTVLADVYGPRPILKLVSGNVDDEFIGLQPSMRLFAALRGGVYEIGQPMIG